MRRSVSYAVLLLLGLAAGCGRKSESDDEETVNVKAVVPVKVIHLRKGDMEEIVEATGRVDALRKQKLFAPVAGRVTSLRILEGAAVHDGDVLAVVQTKESQAAIAGAEALVRSAETKEQKEQAQLALALAKTSQNTISIRASINGTVATRSVSEGEIVAENAEMFALVDLNTLTFLAEVPAHDLTSIAVGQHCRIGFTQFGEMKVLAEVEALNPQTEAMSQTVRVRLRMTSIAPILRKLLRPDMIGTAYIVTGVKKNVWIVPRPALLRNDESNSYSIVAMTPDSLALAVSVEVVGMTDTTAAIAGRDLYAGTRVIVEGNYALADSTHVTILP
jgi:multidrug efflux pump subunit AcrA (membrane-fusion protein)